MHIRVQQRNGRKCITTVQGLNAELDMKKIVKAIKKACLLRLEQHHYLQLLTFVACVGLCCVWVAKQVTLKDERVETEMPG